MFESIVSTSSVSFFLVLLEGFLSFFSPCIIPLIPVYMSYLAGNTNDYGADAQITYNRKKVFLHTVSFVLGISFAFFILAMTFTALGTFFQTNKLLFTRISGILIVLLGLFQLGIFELKFLNRERKFHINLHKREANPIIAFVMGFTFSFAWTPCVGPALSSVLILASSASNSLIGYGLVLVYAIGFIIPFLILGLFTTEALNFLKKNKKLLKYTVKAGGIVLIIMGVMTYTGWMNGISGYLTSITSAGNTTTNESEGATKDKPKEEPKENVEEASEGSTDEQDAKAPVPAMDFTLTDQYGNEHKLSDYKGKVVFLNFWATWCPPCRKEMPDIEELYKQYNFNKDDVVFLGVANPKTKENTNTREVDKAGVIKFLEENDYSFPVVFDETGEVYSEYFISSLPTTFLIDKEGNIFGYAAGMLTKDIMINAITEALKSTK